MKNVKTLINITEIESYKLSNMAGNRSAGLSVCLHSFLLLKNNAIKTITGKFTRNDLILMRRAFRDNLKGDDMKDKEVNIFSIATDISYLKLILKKINNLKHQIIDEVCELDIYTQYFLILSLISKDSDETISMISREMF